MDLDKLPKIRMADLTASQREAVQKLCPRLHDFVLHYDQHGMFIDIDFHFKDDPQRDRVGYTSCSLSEFVHGSQTYNELDSLIDFLDENLELHMRN